MLAAAVLSWPRVPKAWRRDPPTDKQLEYAMKLVIDIPDGCSKGRLSSGRAEPVRTGARPGAKKSTVRS